MGFLSLLIVLKKTQNVSFRFLFMISVSFWKRCQILVGDIWACYEGKGLGYFQDIDSLTMFADYRYVNISKE